MPRWVVACIIAAVLLANSTATCLYSGAGPFAERTVALQPSRDALQFIADLLTLPLPTGGIVDVRDVALLIGLGLALTVLGVYLAGGRAARAPVDCAWTQAPAVIFVDPACRWLLVVAAIIIGTGSISTVANRSLDLSWGWLVRFAAGAGWAILLGRTLSPPSVRRTLPALLALALGAMILALWHRASRGLAYFTWPIGPVTGIGALAAVWAAMAGILAALAALHRRAWPAAVFAAVVCMTAGYVLLATDRRAPAVGLVFGVIVAGAAMLRRWYPRKIVDLGLAAALVIAIGAASLYLASQAGSASRVQAGSVALRFEYWKLSAELIAQQPLLGWGPDTFVVHMTNLVAPLRAYSPHLYHGNIDPYAHNEWVQAAVELGVPAAILSLALPLGVVLIACRRLWRRGPSVPSGGREDADTATIMALIAGVTAIVVLDSASITLRTPIMPVWYWTLLGLLAACCRQPLRQVQPAPSPRGVPYPWRCAGILVLAAACFIFAATDLRRSIAEARRILRPEGAMAARLFAEKTVSSQEENAVLASEAAHARRSDEAIGLSLRLWRELYVRIPGYEDIPARYADVLLLAGRTDEARQVLTDAISDRLTPFDPSANMLYAGRLTEDPSEKLRCVQRALRGGALGEGQQAILSEALQAPAVQAALDEDLPEARRIAAGEPGDSAAGPVVELLRISAFARERAGMLSEAAEDQRLAAEFYRRLDERQSPYRRREEAETDALFNLARLLYAADRANYRQAFDAILAAERYAILGINHQDVADPRPEEGFVGGEVVPLELPERLFPLWRLSALLHLVNGKDRYLDLRVLSSLPPERRTTAELNRELARLARQAHEDLAQLPTASRPAHFTALLDMARRHEQTFEKP